jgi:hypothetical protein
MNVITLFVKILVLKKPKIDCFKTGAAAKDITVSLSGQLEQRLLHAL